MAGREGDLFAVQLGELHWDLSPDSPVAHSIVDVFGFYSLQDNALMDDSFRLFVEECDTFQVPSSLSMGG